RRTDQLRAGSLGPGPGCSLARRAMRWWTLFRLDPAAQVVGADAVDPGWVVGGHVRSDDSDHLVIAVPVGHVSALAPDGFGHRLFPPPAWWPAYGQDGGVSLAFPSPLRIQICGRLTIERGGQRVEAELPGRQ